MRKFTLTLIILASILSGFAQKGIPLVSTAIYVNPITTGRPIATNYLGDKLSTNWYFQFEIGQVSWYASEVGVGQNPDGATGWNWATATYYANGSGNNKQVQRNIGNFQFTATGTWYAVGRAKSLVGDAWAYTDESTGWTNETTLTASTTTGACPYFTVSDLLNPTLASATGSTNSQITLAWTQWSSKNVMIVRRLTSDVASTAPTQGTAYAVNATLGTGTVVFNGAGTGFNSTGLTANTGYTYILYSENYSYYSAGTEVSATTLKPDWSNDYISINKNNAGSIAYWLGNGTGTELNGTDFAVVSSLIITACDMEYTSATEDRTGGSFWYKIMAADNTTPVITEVETLWDQSTPVNKTYKGTKSVAINLLTGLTKNTTFKLHVWAKNWNGLALGDRYLSNGAADYVATFTTDNATSVDQQTNSNLKISSQSGLIEASFEGTKQVELFSVTGQLIRSATVKNQFTQAVKNGAYMLRVNGETHKVVVR